MLKAVERLRVTFMPNINANLYYVTKFSLYFVIYWVYYFNSKISSITPVLSVRIVPDSFHLLIFYSEEFSTWIWCLPLVITRTLNFSSMHQFVQDKIIFFPCYLRSLCLKTGKKFWKILFEIRSNPTLMDSCLMCTPHYYIA